MQPAIPFWHANQPKLQDAKAQFSALRRRIRLPAKCESYFLGVGTLETEEVWLAALHLDGVEAEWFLTIDRDNAQLPWADFSAYVNLRFGPVLR